MRLNQEERRDLEAILSHRGDNGHDHWATSDGRWGKGSPFSTFDCALMLHELGLGKTHEALRGVAEVFFASWRDGRFRPAPKATAYPCYTASAVRVLARLGYARDRRVEASFDHLLDVQHDDGGWRCNKVKLGRSESTDASNPGVTLSVLDAFRYTDAAGKEKRLDRAVATLLSHWGTRAPLGPCAFGIGTLFGRLEYPFLRYNLFWFVYVLSFYPSARGRRPFQQALKTLRDKLIDDQVVVEHSHRRLADLSLCRKGQLSRRATARYREILQNLAS